MVYRRLGHADERENQHFERMASMERRIAELEQEREAIHSIVRSDNAGAQLSAEQIIQVTRDCAMRARLSIVQEEGEAPVGVGTCQDDWMRGDEAEDCSVWNNRTASLRGKRHGPPLDTPNGPSLPDDGIAGGDLTPEAAAAERWRRQAHASRAS